MKKNLVITFLSLTTIAFFVYGRVQQTVAKKAQLEVLLEAQRAHDITEKLMQQTKLADSLQVQLNDEVKKRQKK